MPESKDKLLFNEMYGEGSHWGGYSMIPLVLLQNPQYLVLESPVYIEERTDKKTGEVSTIEHKPLMTATHVAILCNLLSRRNTESKTSFPSVNRISKDLNISPSTVKKYINQMVGWQILDKHERVSQKESINRKTNEIEISKHNLSNLYSFDNTKVAISRAVAKIRSLKDPRK